MAAVTTDISAFPFDWEALGLPKLSKNNKIPSCKGLPGVPVCTRKGKLHIATYPNTTNYDRLPQHLQILPSSHIPT